MRRAIISFTVLTSDAGVCFHGKKGFTGVGFDTLVARAEARQGGGEDVEGKRCQRRRMIWWKEKKQGNQGKM